MYTAHRTSQNMSRTPNLIIQGNASPHMMSQPYSHQYQWKMPYKSLRKTRTGHMTPSKDHHVSTPPHTSTRVVSQQIILVPWGTVLWTDTGCSHRSPTSPVVANLYTGDFETKNLRTVENPLIWNRCGWHLYHKGYRTHGQHLTTHKVHRQCN